MIMRNHGLLTCGETVGAAFVRMYYLERACNLQLQVMATGQEMELPTAAVRERAARQAESFEPGEFEWPALLRLVDTECPDFRD
jgi:ribulose-5-phosphate 4-epimerase/fuculose-1-phosphate aldolase